MSTSRFGEFILILVTLVSMSVYSAGFLFTYYIRANVAWYPFELSEQIKLIFGSLSGLTGFLLLIAYMVKKNRIYFKSLLVAFILFTVLFFFMTSAGEVVSEFVAYSPIFKLH